MKAHFLWPKIITFCLHKNSILASLTSINHFKTWIWNTIRYKKICMRKFSMMSVSTDSSSSRSEKVKINQFHLSDTISNIYQVECFLVIINTSKQLKLNVYVFQQTLENNLSESHCFSTRKGIWDNEKIICDCQKIKIHFWNLPLGYYCCLYLVFWLIVSCN